VIQFSIGMTGLDETMQRLGRLSSHLADYTPVWPGVIASIGRMEERAFAAGGGTTAHGRWAALEPGYKRWKDRHYPGRPILTLTGDMRRSLTRRGAMGHFEDIGRMRLEVGTTIPYARFHQERGHRKWRPMIDPTKQQLVGVLAKVIQRYVFQRTRDWRSSSGGANASFSYAMAGE
jgi:phage gpG-like protein